MWQGGIGTEGEGGGEGVFALLVLLWVLHQDTYVG